MSEKCDRCGNEGADRRTLWMRCFYAMEELDVPFSRAAIHGQYCELRDTKTESFGGYKFNIPIFAEPNGEATNVQFYTLRVCKRCRGEWMVAIRAWFHAVPEGEDHDADLHEPNPAGTGVFVREGGAIKELTADEVAKRWPNEPTIKPVSAGVTPANAGGWITRLLAALGVKQ